MPNKLMFPTSLALFSSRPRSSAEPHHRLRGTQDAHPDYLSEVSDSDASINAVPLKYFAKFGDRLKSTDPRSQDEFVGTDGLVLGLGDIVVPGMLLGLAFRLDVVRNKRRKVEVLDVPHRHLTQFLDAVWSEVRSPSYFNACMFGYVVGFLVTFAVSIASEAAQVWACGWACAGLSSSMIA